MMFRMAIVISLCFITCQGKLDNASLYLLSEAKIEATNKELIAKAHMFLDQEARPITMFLSERSSGGPHDFYSEGDYWWPDPNNPEGPYIRRDGLSNPNNFVAHRKAMRNLSEWVTTLVAAYSVTREEKFAIHALSHLHAFFVNPATAMNPSLLYAQAIQGRHQGRGIGIIDTIHLIEVVKSILKLKALGKLDENDFEIYKRWFDQYASWMNTHKYGLDEKNHGNNHSTWWAAQMAAFALIAEREDLMEVARNQFKKLITFQMSVDGSFPDELERTKPYNYTLFNLEGYAVICELASTEEENLWNYEGKSGTLRKAFDFMLPYIRNKSNWIKPPDVSHFDEIPIQSVGLLLAALAYEDKDYMDVWISLSAEKKSEEVKRNFPLWHPQNWL